MSEQRPYGDLSPDIKTNLTEYPELRSATIPRYEFEGTQDDESKHAVFRFLEERRENFVLSGELEPNEMQEQCIQFILEELKEYAQELGTQTDRLPTRQQIHLLQEDDFKKFIDQQQKLGRLPAHAADTSAVQGYHLILEGQVVVSASTPLHKFVHFLAHELVHEATFLSFKIDDSKPQIKTNVAKTGVQYFHRDEDLEITRIESVALNEAMVELSGLHIRHRILNKHKSVLEQQMSAEELQYLYGSVEYSAPIQITLDVAREVANKNGEDPKDVYLRFQKYLFTGSEQIFTEIEKSLGQAAVNMLKDMTPDKESGVKVAQELGLHHSEQALREHRPINLI